MTTSRTNTAHSASTMFLLMRRTFWHPRYWFTWLGIGVLRSISQLPFGWQLGLGKCIGTLCFYTMRRRRHIAQVNLQLCFPELTAQQRLALLRQNFQSTGIALCEMATAWWAKPQNLPPLIQFEGREYFEAAIQKGKGVIMLCAHFTTLEMCGRLLAHDYPIHAMYRPVKNKLFDTVMLQARQNVFAATLKRDNMRAIIKSLKQGANLYYAGDQDYGRKYSVFAPFFGIPAASIVAVLRMARLTGASIVPFMHYRTNTPQSGYVIRALPALNSLPSGDDIADMTYINQLIENFVRECPEQYLWIHRRFKTRPDKEPRPY
ncbi:MAG: lipid A biosynthesis lauroyl acyltransferase [Gammaproteobacteria bacterium]